MISTDKIFYNPGDLVTIRHDLIRKPTMYVVEKVTRSIVHKNEEKDSIFIGIKCRWFDNQLVLREAIFSTKDLIHVEE